MLLAINKGMHKLKGRKREQTPFFFSTMPTGKYRRHDRFGKKSPFCSH
jgi:hypothetical protein